MEKKIYITPELGEIVLSDDLMDIDLPIASQPEGGDFDAKGDMGTWDDEDWVNDNE